MRTSLQGAKKDHDAIWEQHVAGVAHIHLRVREKLMKLGATSITMDKGSDATNTAAPIINSEL